MSIVVAVLQFCISWLIVCVQPVPIYVKPVLGLESDEHTGPGNHGMKSLQFNL